MEIKPTEGFPELISGATIELTIYNGDNKPNADSICNYIKKGTVIPLDGTDLQIEVLDVHTTEYYTDTNVACWHIRIKCLIL